MSGKTSNASKAKYNAKTYDRIQLVVAKGRKDEIQAHAAAKGESLNGYVTKAVDERIERDRATTSDLKGANDDAGI